MALTAALPATGAHAASDLHDLYNALQSKGRAVTVPGKMLTRLGLPAFDMPGKEFAVTETGGDRRGITAFDIGGAPTLTMFHVETDKDDWWWLRFQLDGRVINEKYGQKDIGIAEVPSPVTAQREIDFWRQWIADKARP